MDKSVLCVYFIILIILFILYFRNQRIIKRFEASSGVIEDYAESIKSIIEYRNAVAGNEIEIKKGKVYCFDAIKNSISIGDDVKHSEYNLFAFSHEIGHAIECHRYRCIYILLSVINVLLPLLYFASIVVAFLYIKGCQSPNIACTILYGLTIVLFVIKTVSLGWIEKNASLQAITIMDKYGKKSVSYNRIINAAILNQYLVNVLWLITILLPLYYLYG